MKKEAPLSAYGRQKQIEEAQQKAFLAAAKGLFFLLSGIMLIGAAWCYSHEALASGAAFGILIIVFLWARIISPGND